MKNYLLLILIPLLLISCKEVDKQEGGIVEKKQKQDMTFAIVLHGGAGSIKKAYFTPEQEKAYTDKLSEALDAGYLVLQNNGSALDAVQQTINVMENSPLFNAGKGAVLNSLGKVEMDASIMDGKTLNCGAVAGVAHIKNPIIAARLVMDSTRHVFLYGEGAEIFAKEKGIQLMDVQYFITSKRQAQLKRLQAKEAGKKIAYKTPIDKMNDHKYGTVGCVALDKNGNIAAGTSTGGMMNKKYGRIGDSPIVGAGTYANNQTCGISCTGTGEYFIRTLASHTVSDLMQYKNNNLLDAMKIAMDKIQDLGGDGGMIGLDTKANIAWYFNTDGMFRAYKKSNGEKKIKLFKN